MPPGAADGSAADKGVPPRRWADFVWAALVAIAAVLITSLLRNPVGGGFYFVMVAGMLVIALNWGAFPGVLGLAVMIVGNEYVVIAPDGSVALTHRQDQLRLLSFAVTSMAVIAVASRARQSALHQRMARQQMAALAAAERRTREFYEQLQQVTAACSASASRAEIAHVVLRDGLSHLGAKAVNLMILEAERAHLRLSFTEGVPTDELPPYSVIPMSAPFPSPDCIRTGKPAFIESPSEIQSRYPVLGDVCRRSGLAALAFYPLKVAGEPIGVLGFGFSSPRILSEDEREYAAALTNHLAEALARASSLEAEQAAHQEARRIAELQERVMAVVGHDLRSPLAAIKIGAEGLLRKAESLTPSQAQTLWRINRTADRMNGIIGDLLDVVRSRRGMKMALALGPLDVADALRHIIEEFTTGNVSAHVELQVEHEARVVADDRRLSQVFANLIGNAIQHGEGKVSVTVGGDEGNVLVRVHNGGTPIPADMINTLFEPFTRGNDAHAVGGTGSIGLGLFIAREVVEAHEGHLRVESNEETGTTFTVRLPRASPGARPSRASSTPEARAVA